MNSGEDPDLSIFGSSDCMVTVWMEGKLYKVPKGLELIRCFQFLRFLVAFEKFCWNGACGNCRAEVESGGHKVLRNCCLTPAEEGMRIDTLPSGIIVR